MFVFVKTADCIKVWARNESARGLPHKVHWTVSSTFDIGLKKNTKAIKSIIIALQLVSQNFQQSKDPAMIYPWRFLILQAWFLWPPELVVAGNVLPIAKAKLQRDIWGPRNHFQEYGSGLLSSGIQSSSRPRWRISRQRRSPELLTEMASASGVSS